MSTYIGIDLGTSSVKLLLADGQGRILGMSTAEYPVCYPKSGWSEQNPHDWTAGVMAGLEKLLEGRDAKAVKAISFGGQMHGLVMLDKACEVIRPAILWNDGRTKPQTDWLNNVVGKEKLVSLTGNIAFAGFTAPKILWVRENEKENFGCINKIMLPKDYVAHYLTGGFSTDMSDASGTLLFNVAGRDWSDGMLDICGVDRDWLPKAYESYECVGIVKAEIADKLGLRRDVKVVAGAGDNASAAVGVGAVSGGQCNISVGTSGTVFAPTAQYFAAENNAVHVFCHADGGWHQMGCMLSATLCGDWWAKSALHSDIVTEEKAAGDQLLGKNDVFFLPYLMGERSPHNDTSARGAFIGLHPSVTREQMTLAVLEGVAFGLRDSLEAIKRNGLKITSSKICGGGSKSAVWKKIMTNVFDIPLGVPEVTEGASYGAAMLAMVGAGEYKTVKDAAAACTGTKEMIHPEKTLASEYNERYNVFRGMYPALREVFNKL